MGNNLNLVELFGFPKTIECPSCKRDIASDFDDYDIDSGEPFDNGSFNLHCHCPDCEDNNKPCEFYFTGKILILEFK